MKILKDIPWYFDMAALALKKPTINWGCTVLYDRRRQTGFSDIYFNPNKQAFTYA
jgi:hypothetical protein